MNETQVWQDVQDEREYRWYCPKHDRVLTVNENEYLAEDITDKATFQIINDSSGLFCDPDKEFDDCQDEWAFQYKTL